MTLKEKLTYDDYAALPDDGKRHELVAGELYVVPAPNLSHQDVAKRLFRKLDAFFEENKLGEVFFAPLDVILGPHDVAEPDILVVTDPSQFSTRGIEGPPSLLVEILSPSNRTHDLVTKARRYLELRVEHYWIVDPDARRLICQRAAADRWVTVAEGRDAERVCDPAWPALTIDLADLWRPL
jgi:Uma2 family endonuclease